MQRTSLLVPILFSGNCTFVFAAKEAHSFAQIFFRCQSSNLTADHRHCAAHTSVCSSSESGTSLVFRTQLSFSSSLRVCASNGFAFAGARGIRGPTFTISLKRPRGALCFRSPEMALEAPRTVDDVADNFENRREGLIMALTTGAKKQLRSLTTRPPIAGCVTFVGSMDAGKNSVGRVRGVPREQPAPSHWAVFPSLAFHDNTPHITCPISLTSRPPTISHARNQRRRGFLRGVGSRQGKSLSLRKPGWHVGSAAPSGRGASGASGAGARD